MMKHQDISNVMGAFMPEEESQPGYSIKEDQSYIEANSEILL